jgi:hypothetical protein
MRSAKLSALIIITLVISVQSACVSPAAEPAASVAAENTPVPFPETATRPASASAETLGNTPEPVTETILGPTPEITPAPVPAKASYTAVTGAYSQSSFLIDGNNVLWRGVKMTRDSLATEQRKAARRLSK